MIEAIPPFSYVLVAAVVVVVVPARIGHLLGGLATAAVGIHALWLDNGTYLDISFLGFDVVLFHVDAASRLVAVAVATLATAAVIYAGSTGVDRVRTAFALSYVSSTVGVVFAGDWLTMIVFWEVMAVTSTVLVWHFGGDAVRAGFRYALFHGIGGTILLAGVLVHYAAVGSFHYAATGIADVAVPLAAIGIGINCGFIFLHSWLPDTYPRPHVASSVFLSVFTTKTAAYVMFRAFPDEQLWLAYMGGAMAVYGVFFALLQYDPRRLLTYHIQAQVGYMLAGIGIGSQIATAGGLAHLFNNVLFKALLFMAVGVVIYRTGEEDIRNLGGLWNVMPLTFIAYVVGAASITALPATNGFVSKGMVLDEAHHLDLYPVGSSSMPLGGEDVLWWLLIIGAIGTFMSFIKLGYYIFFHGSNTIDPTDASVGQTAAMFTVGGFCLLYGVFPGLLFDLLPYTDHLSAELTPYSVGHLTESLALLVVSVGLFWALKEAIAHIAWLPDVDRVLFPAGFYTGRWLVWGVTETWAAVDRLVMAMAGAAMHVGTHPRGYVGSAADRVPGLDVSGFSPTEDASSIRLRASTGMSIFIVTFVLVVGLAALLFLL